ncbi:cytochrome P450 [Suillus clintonianus]|uniref:cytochrome P450 n=1 Tax=Suillus clintonianus TaxID=1904413 RepID=UPI001B868501|nr:cytochrome P450 [Suillus clintonianus]KAG2130367.1 cytochrome P450 [Suillus clintonianus]
MYYVYLLLCAVGSIFYAIWYSYFARNPLDNISGPPRQHWWTGNLSQVFARYSWDFHDMLAERHGPVSKFYGIFGARHLYVFDPKAMYHIMVKDQHNFEAAPSFLATSKVLFGDGLLATSGEHHRKQRKLLNPVFSLSHVRDMVPTFIKVTTCLRDGIAAEVEHGPREINMLEWLNRTALELVGQSGLGYSFDCLKEGDVNPYSIAVKNLLPSIYKLSVVRQFLPLLINVGTPNLRRFVVKIFPWKAVKEISDIVDVMHKTSMEVFEEKKRAISEGDDAVLHQVGEGKDIMSILLRANMDASAEDRLPDSELVAQMSTLVFAATHTTAGALCRTLLTLAHQQDAQDRLRKEIQQVMAEPSELDYDALANLPYLDAVCRETLRLYPPATFAMRVAREDIVLPFSRPVKGNDGTYMREVLVPKNTNVMMSILNSNRDPEIWGDDVLQWKPERWLSPLPKSVIDAEIPGVYSHLMTFIGGGRACIGFKFSELEMKVVLYMLVRTFKFTATQEIEWTAQVSSPNVKGSGSKWQMPLRVEMIAT